MGLIVKMHVDTDPDVYIRDTPYLLVESVPDEYVVLRRETDGHLFTLTANGFTELERNVEAGVGRGPNDRRGQSWITWTRKGARVEFKAPRDIRILLGTLRRRRTAA